MHKMKEYWFDLDGTLCTEEHSGRRALAQPYTERVKKVNNLFYDGHFVGIFTARTWGEYDMTKKWLDENDVRHHILICGKPCYSVFVDDKSQKPEDFFNDTTS